MKLVWVNADPWNKDLVTAALEAGADGVMVPSGRSADVHALGLLQTIAPDGDLRLGEEVVEVHITDKASESLALTLGQTRTVIVSAADWRIIPLENLIAGGATIIARVASAEEALTAVTTLEAGCAGVLLTAADPAEVKRTVALLKARAEQLPLESAVVTGVRPVGMGDRVCVDTCTNMGLGEGMLVGNSSAALFLVHSESVENPYVEPRPFRVNAGPVHAYIRVPGGRTRYLSELQSGDQALLVAHDGTTRISVVGRAKTERRPLLLVTAEAREKPISVILQNAETIRLVTPEGQPISVVDLKRGTEVLVLLDEPGRHFGTKVTETISER